MAGYFFDSSALVKLYHPEAGTPLVDQIVNAADNLVRVSRLTVAELTSAFAIKVRTQSISREDAEFFLRQFRRDIANREAGSFLYRRIGIRCDRIAGGALRVRLASACLDALQLAVALELRNQKLVDHFVAADTILCEVAGLEGFSVINPEHS